MQSVKIPPTFITKYKPYHIQDFCVTDQFKLVLKTLFEIDDLNMMIIAPTSSCKTTLLYAIIREYYGLNKTQSLPENNLLFINNLKEQGINYYRTEMKTFCQSHSYIYGKKKMIIVDDLDMVNEQCQQVFRNYIDKYKNNVHFISTCSNAQKVIESIQSRIYIIRVDPPTDLQIRHIMQNVIEKEDIRITEEAQEYLLLFSKHSIRELLNHLEKIYIIQGTNEKNTNEKNANEKNTNKIIESTIMSKDMCKTICSTISLQQFEQYIEMLTLGDRTGAIRVLYDIYDYGYSVIDIFDYFYTKQDYYHLSLLQHAAMSLCPKEHPNQHRHLIPKNIYDY